MARSGHSRKRMGGPGHPVQVTDSYDGKLKITFNACESLPLIAAEAAFHALQDAGEFTAETTIEITDHQVVVVVPRPVGIASSRSADFTPWRGEQLALVKFMTIGVQLQRQRQLHKVEPCDANWLVDWIVKRFEI